MSQRVTRSSANPASTDHVNGDLQRTTRARSKRRAPYKHENVFLFLPNIIGYARVVIALGSLYFMPLHPRRCSVLYSISCLMDALDGYVARRCNQQTRFGAVLDMVTDRCTTTCLLVFLASAKPAFSMIFQSLISLDFASHYMHMYATLAMGGQGQSHKTVSAERSSLMHLYYTNKWVLFTCCALNELFFIALYLLCFSSPLITPALLPNGGLVTNSTTPALPQPRLMFPSPFSAAAMEMARANKMDSTVPWILTIASAPIMLAKQYINGHQLYTASLWLAEGDVRDRKQAYEQGDKEQEKKDD